MRHLTGANRRARVPTAYLVGHTGVRPSPDEALTTTDEASRAMQGMSGVALWEPLLPQAWVGAGNRSETAFDVRRLPRSPGCARLSARGIYRWVSWAQGRPLGVPEWGGGRSTRELVE